MRTLDGTKWEPDHGPNPTIQSWQHSIGTTYPNMASYCSSVGPNYFSWCGLTVGNCMAKAGIAPVFGQTDNNRFLHAVAWLGWGTPVTTPLPGDVLVFDFGGGDHHVTLFEKDNGDGTFSCHGGNQTHEVKLTNFHKSSLMGIRRPSVGAVVPQAAAGTLAPGAEGRAVTALQSALAAQGFDPGGIDGEFGPGTSAAVSKFQRAHNLPVTGIADPATLQRLGPSADGGPRPNIATEEPTMQVQDLLKTLVDALIAKQQGTAPAAVPGLGPIDTTQLLQAAIAALAGKPLPAQAAAGTGAGPATGPTGVTQLLQGAISALAGKPLPALAAPGIGTSTVATPPVLSTIDQIFGGQALAGKKTMLAVIAYVILAILQATKMVDATGAPSEIVTTLITAFGALGGLAKIDRVAQAVSLIANQSTQK